MENETSISASMASSHVMNRALVRKQTNSTAARVDERSQAICDTLETSDSDSSARPIRQPVVDDESAETAPADDGVGTGDVLDISG